MNPGTVLGFFNFDNPLALIVLAIIALLVFGKRLPEVGRSLGKGIIEFKKGLSGVEDDVNRAGTASSAEPPAQIAQTPAPPQVTATSAEKPKVNA